MKTHKNTPIAIRQLIIHHRQKGKKIREISRLVGVPKSTVAEIVSRNDAGLPLAESPRTGRPRKTTNYQDRVIVRKSKADVDKTAVDIAKEMHDEYQLSVNRMTISRRLAAENLNGRIPVKKPLISKKNRMKRLEFARTYQHWTIDDWKKVLWSDESKFNLFGSDGKKYIRRPPGTRNDVRYQKPTVKHGGGNVMVWGAFSFAGVGPLVHVDRIMDMIYYRDILKDNMLPYAKRNMPRGWIFQQDNDPKHTSGLVKKWFVDNKVRVLEWPSQSPDLNPIEHLWNELGKRVGITKHSNKSQLLTNLEHEWGQIPQATIQKLVESMPRRCAAVIKAKGYSTKY